MHKPSPTTCSYCGSTKIVVGVRLSQTAEVGGIGLSYKALGPFMGTERVVADLCDECGTLNRLYVKEVGKRWSQS
jgi:hypothetical protein